VLDRRDGVLGDVSVKEVMEPSPLTTDPHMAVMELRGKMLERHARYVPVMDGATLLGVVSFHDVARAIYEEQSFENTMLKDYIAAA
jgi:CBS domain-containing protein